MSGAAQTTRIDRLMQEKLQHAQSMLQAMILGEYKTVETLADRLIKTSEVSEWSLSQDPAYADEFKATVAMLAENAVEREVDGLVINYADMTRTCVACHHLLGD